MFKYSFIVIMNIGEPKMTHHLIDGECRDSLAFATAKLFGLPDHIIARALQLSRELKRYL